MVSNRSDKTILTLIQSYSWVLIFFSAT